MLLGDGPQWFSGSKVFLLIVYLLGTWAALVCHPREGPPARQDLPPPPSHWPFLLCFSLARDLKS